MKVVWFIERSQRDVVEKILRQCGLWEGPLRTLARATPNTAESHRDASVAVLDAPSHILATRTRRSGRGDSPIAQSRPNSRMAWRRKVSGVFPGKSAARIVAQACPIAP